MPLSDMILRSNVIPPQSHRAVFYRPRLQEKLTTSFRSPLTLIHAGTGFGKTTALVQLRSLYPKTFWYNITEPDRDPMLFIAHLISAFFPESSDLLERLERGGTSAAPAVLNGLLNQLTLDLEEDSILILDDFHLVGEIRDVNRWFEQLVENRPPRLSIAIACRQIPETPAFIRWRVKGNVQIINQEDLSFTQNEIVSLFSTLYDFPITEQQASTLFSYTDGWIIALQMVWQRLQTSRSKNLDHILSELPSALSEIFNFLAQEVLLRQPEQLQQFLISSAVLRQMDADSCNALMDISNSENLLQQLSEKGLFISSVVSAEFRYQRLFQDFLLNQVKNDPDMVNGLHKKAAAYYVSINEYEEAIFHLFSCKAMKEAAHWIESISPNLIEIGRLGTVAYWIKQLDENLINQHPNIWLLLGEVHRLCSKFEEAITCYSKAEKIFELENNFLGRSHSLRYKAQVYLDTIRPLKASSLLEEALSLLEPQEHPAEVAILLDQLAENKLNLGRPDEARTLHKEAGMLRSESDPDDIYLEARSLLRTGHLYEAVTLLEPYTNRALASTSTHRPQKFHREMPLLLALINVMLGDFEKGEKYARQGIEIGKQLDSPFVEAVGLIRLGHSFQLHPHVPWQKNRLNNARLFYERSLELIRPFNVVRVQVEPLWGLCRYYGYQGDLLEAKRLAMQAIEIAGTAGDHWLVALVQTTLGTSYTLSGEVQQAEKWLLEGISGFENVKDTFGNFAAKCAMILNDWLYGSKQKALTQFQTVAPELKRLNLSLLLTKPTHLGVQDPQPFFPMLIEAQKQGIEEEWIRSLLFSCGLGDSDFHPGYGLDICTLGQFDVWRGNYLTNPRDWQREKARQLFQFFIGNRGKWFTREQISDRIWPQLNGDASTQNLKVALNALNRALEPNRESGQTPHFIARRDNLYGVNPAAKINLDLDDFIALASSTSEEDLKIALEIYRGDYMCDSFDEDWAADTRETFRNTFLESANRLAEIYMQSNRWEEALTVSKEILAVDSCNEIAFQIMMKSFAAKGNRIAVHSTYQRCSSVLREELEIVPSRETTALWKELTK